MEAPSFQGFNLEQTFFGFKPEHRVDLHDQLFNILWAGEGRWTWTIAVGAHRREPFEGVRRRPSRNQL